MAGVNLGYVIGTILEIHEDGISLSKLTKVARTLWPNLAGLRFHRLRRVIYKLLREMLADGLVEKIDVKYFIV